MVVIMSDLLPCQIIVKIKNVTNDMHKWLCDTIGIPFDDWCMVKHNDNIYCSVYFKNEEDAIEFKLLYL